MNTVTSPVSPSTSPFTLDKVKLVGDGGPTSLAFNWLNADFELRTCAQQAPVGGMRVAATVEWKDGLRHQLTLTVFPGDQHRSANLLAAELRSVATRWAGVAAPEGKTLADWTAELKATAGDLYEALVAKAVKVLAHVPEDAPFGRWEQEDEGDPWGGDDALPAVLAPVVVVPVNDAPAVPAKPPPAPPAPPPEVSVASLIQGVVPYRKGRLVGDFAITVLGDAAVYVALRGVSFCGKDHSGSLYLKDRGTRVDGSNTYVRAGTSDSPTWAARKAIEEAAMDVARQWIARHPDAFEAADCVAARAAEMAAASKVRKLSDDLSAAEVKATEARLDLSRREAALANRGIVFTDGEGAQHSP